MSVGPRTYLVVTNLGDKFDLFIEPDTTIGDVRALVSAMCSRPRDCVSDDQLVIRLSVRGVQALDDSAAWETLKIDHASISNGEKLYASVICKPLSAAAPANIPVGASGLVSTGGSTKKEEEEQQRQQARMMEPMIDAMVSNPQFFDSMISMQPELQKLIRENPEAERELRNPETLKSLLMAQFDPDQKRQLSRTMQLQLAQISNIPGGTAAIERHMNSVLREPSARKTASDLHEASEAHARPNPNQNSNSAALPNPWQRTQQEPQRFAPPAMALPRPSIPLPLFSSPSAPVGPSLPVMEQVPPSREAAASAEDYSAQLVTLLEMGFDDEDLCMKALQHTRGDIDAAVCFIAEQLEQLHNTSGKFMTRDDDLD